MNKELIDRLFKCIENRIDTGNFYIGLSDRAVRELLSVRDIISEEEVISLLLLLRSNFSEQDPIISRVISVISFYYTISPNLESFITETFNFSLKDCHYRNPRYYRSSVVCNLKRDYILSKTVGENAIIIPKLSILAKKGGVYGVETVSRKISKWYISKYRIKNISMVEVAIDDIVAVEKQVYGVDLICTLSPSCFKDVGKDLLLWRGLFL